jgi:hypothetical protein
MWGFGLISDGSALISKGGTRSFRQNIQICDFLAVFKWLIFFGLQDACAVSPLFSVFAAKRVLRLAL